MLEQSPVPKPYEIRLTPFQTRNIDETIEDLGGWLTAKAVARGHRMFRTHALQHTVDLQTRQERRMGEDILYPLAKALKEARVVTLTPETIDAESPVFRVKTNILDFESRQIILEAEEVNFLLAVLFGGFEWKSMELKGIDATNIRDMLQQGSVVQLSFVPQPVELASQT